MFYISLKATATTVFPKCRLLCEYDLTQLHRIIFRCCLLLSQFFRWQKRTAGKLHDLLKVIQLTWSCSHAMDFRDSTSYLTSCSQLKGKVRIWTKSCLRSMLTVISHYHSLFLLISPKEHRRTGVMTKIPGLQKLEE